MPAALAARIIADCTCGLGFPFEARLCASRGCGGVVANPPTQPTCSDRVGIWVGTMRMTGSACEPPLRIIMGVRLTCPFSRAPLPPSKFSFEKDLPSDTKSSQCTFWKIVVDTSLLGFFDLLDFLLVLRLFSARFGVDIACNPALIGVLRGMLTLLEGREDGAGLEIIGARPAGKTRRIGTFESISSARDAWMNFTDDADDCSSSDFSSYFSASFC